MSKQSTSLSRSKTGDAPTSSVPAKPDAGENSASSIIEAPQTPGVRKLTQHDFPDGGGSGGAEGFRRGKRQEE